MITQTRNLNTFYFKMCIFQYFEREKKCFKKNTFTYFRITRLFYGGSMGFFKGSLPNFNLEEIHPDMIFSKYQCYQQPSNRLSFEMQLGF